MSRADLFAGYPFGMKVIVDPTDRPKLRVRDEVPMTDEGRRKMNEWLLERFGTQGVIPPNSALVFGDSLIVMRPDMAALLKNLAI